MLFHCILICLGLSGLAAPHDFALALPTDADNPVDIRTGFAALENNRSEQWNIIINPTVNGTTCSCHCYPHPKPVRDDYSLTPGIGWHKLHTRAKTWNEARKICIEEGGHLAILNSVTEANVLTGVFARSGPLKDAKYDYEAFIGVHDMFAEGDWVTVLGDSMASAGYSSWTNKWGGQPDNRDGGEHCGALVAGSGDLDDILCYIKLPFFCELPL